MRWLTDLLQAFGPRLLVASTCIATGVLLFGHLVIVPQQWRWWVWGIFLITATWSAFTSVKPIAKTVSRAYNVVAVHPFIRPLSEIEKQILLALGESNDGSMNFKYYSNSGRAARNLSLRVILRKMEKRELIYRNDMMAFLTERGEKWAAKVARTAAKRPTE